MEPTSVTSLDRLDTYRKRALLNETQGVYCIDMYITCSPGCSEVFKFGKEKLIKGDMAESIKFGIGH